MAMKILFLVYILQSKEIFWSKCSAVAISQWKVFFLVNILQCKLKLEFLSECHICQCVLKIAIWYCRSCKATRSANIPTLWHATKVRWVCLPASYPSRACTIHTRPLHRKPLLQEITIQQPCQIWLQILVWWQKTSCM